MLTSLNGINSINFIGMALFSINLLLYVGYMILFIKKITRIKSFEDYLGAKNEHETGIKKNIHHFYIIYFVEKFAIASIFVFLAFFKPINCIIAGLHLIIILLLIKMKPYKVNESESYSGLTKKSPSRLIIRQLLNYGISATIQIIFFVTSII
jgi:hypothetical protein